MGGPGAPAGPAALVRNPHQQPARLGDDHQPPGPAHDLAVEFPRLLPVGGDGQLPEPQCGQLTRRLAEAAELLQIKLLDHIIIGEPLNGNPGYFSFKEAGVL